MTRAAKKPHGGKRTGAGRKRDKLPDELLARVGAPPQDPKAMRTWALKLLSETGWAVLTGTISVGLAASVRAFVGSLDRLLPEPPRATAPDDEDEDTDERAGPELEADDDDGDTGSGGLEVQ